MYKIIFKILLYTFIAGFLLFLGTGFIPMGHTDKHYETIGRIQYYGFPIPHKQSAPGLSIMSSIMPLEILLSYAFWNIFSFSFILYLYYPYIKKLRKQKG